MANLFDFLQKKRPAGLFDVQLLSNEVTPEQETWEKEDIAPWAGPEDDRARMGIGGERGIAGFNEAISNIAAAHNERVPGEESDKFAHYLVFNLIRSLEGLGFEHDPQSLLNLFKRYMTPEQFKNFSEREHNLFFKQLPSRIEKGWDLDWDEYYRSLKRHGFWDALKPWVMQ